MPLQIATTGGASSQTLTWHADTAPVMEALGALSGFSLNNPTSGFNSSGAVVTGANGVPVTTPTGAEDVVRVIGPATVAPTNAAGNTVYPSFGDYIAHLENAGGAPIPTEIAGANGVLNGGFQTYDLTVTIANQTSTINGTAINPGDVVFTGTIDSGDGTNIPTTAVISAADFTDSTIYGAAAPFTIAQGDANTNNVMTRAVADYLSGLNFGLVGSPEPNPNDPGHTIGDSPSYTWYGNLPGGTAGPELPITDAFAKAQPITAGQTPYFNAYAGALVPITDAYGFPFNDRLQLPLETLDPNTTLTVTVLSDTGRGNDGLTVPGVPVPEPSSLALLAGALGMLLLVTRKIPSLTRRRR